MSPSTSPLYLEDLSVGQRFVSAERTVDLSEITAFATAYDPQPFHLDPEAATDTFFAGLAASGWHTAALTMRMMVETVPLAGGLIGAGGELAWPEPVRPGDVLHVECEVISITRSRTRPERGSAVLRITTRNQNGQIVQSFSPKVILARRPTADRRT